MQPKLTSRQVEIQFNKKIGLTGQYIKMQKAERKNESIKRTQMRKGYANQQQAATQLKETVCQSLADFEQLAYQRKGDKPIRSAMDLGYNYIGKNDKTSKKYFEQLLGNKCHMSKPLSLEQKMVKIVDSVESYAEQLTRELPSKTTFQANNQLQCIAEGRKQRQETQTQTFQNIDDHKFTAEEKQERETDKDALKKIINEEFEQFPTRENEYDKKVTDLMANLSPRVKQYEEVTKNTILINQLVTLLSKKFGGIEWYDWRLLEFLLPRVPPMSFARFRDGESNFDKLIEQVLCNDGAKLFGRDKVEFFKKIADRYHRKIVDNNVSSSSDSESEENHSDLKPVLNQRKETNKSVRVNSATSKSVRANSATQKQPEHKNNTSGFQKDQPFVSNREETKPPLKLKRSQSQCQDLGQELNKAASQKSPESSYRSNNQPAVQKRKQMIKQAPKPKHSVLGQWANNPMAKEYLFLAILKEDNPENQPTINETHQEILEVDQIQKRIKQSYAKKHDVSKFLKPPRKLRPHDICPESRLAYPKSQVTKLNVPKESQNQTNQPSHITTDRNPSTGHIRSPKLVKNTSERNINQSVLKSVDDLKTDSTQQRGPLQRIARPSTGQAFVRKESSKENVYGDSNQPKHQKQLKGSNSVGQLSSVNNSTEMTAKELVDIKRVMRSMKLKVPHGQNRSANPITKQPMGRNLRYHTQPEYPQQVYPGKQYHHYIVPPNFHTCQSQNQQFMTMSSYDSSSFMLNEARGSNPNNVNAHPHHNQGHNLYVQGWTPYCATKSTDSLNPLQVMRNKGAGVVVVPDNFNAYSGRSVMQKVTKSYTSLESSKNSLQF